MHWGRRQDCNGTPGGSAVIDDCGICDIYPSNDNTTCTQDCNGDWNGTAYLDNCTKSCVGGNTGEFSCGEVTSVTGRIWLDRNLGAGQVAESSTDSLAYGDLYQWGRFADGHESRSSSTTTTLSSTDDPEHGDFIKSLSSPFDWITGQNDGLWQEVSGINNPCPPGFRLPTEEEFAEERDSWESTDAAGAFASPLKLVVAGYRHYNNANIYDAGNIGYYWSSTVSDSNSRYLALTASSFNTYNYYRAYGRSVRCIKN